MTWNTWIYGQKIGWWLDETGYDNLADAFAAINESIESGPDERTGGAVLPVGISPSGKDIVLNPARKAKKK